MIYLFFIFVVYVPVMIRVGVISTSQNYEAELSDIVGVLGFTL